MARIAAATIAAKSFLPYARVVAASFREHHPGVPFFVLLADEVDGCFDPTAEPFELLPDDADANCRTCRLLHQAWGSTDLYADLQRAHREWVRRHWPPAGRCSRARCFARGRLVARGGDIVHQGPLTSERP